jgi:heme/copper-type cytochrome/quinol oxidase subunit 3
MNALALPPAAPPARRNVSLVGTGFAIAAGAMLLGGLIASYFAARQGVRAAGEVWFDYKETPLPNVAISVTYAALLLSSFTVQWAVTAIKADDRRQAYTAAGLTIFLGAAFINGLTFIWNASGQEAGHGGFADHMYAVTVAHLLLVISGLVFLAVMLFRVLGGQFGPRNSEFVLSAAVFWHFVVVAGGVVWWCVWFLNTVPRRN